jgi:hypothetical protein
MYKVAFQSHGEGTSIVTPNKPLQRSGLDKVVGRGRGRAAAKIVMCARVLMRLRPAAERGR